MIYESVEKVAAIYGFAMEKEALNTGGYIALKARQAAKAGEKVVKPIKQTFGGLRQTGRITGTVGGNPAVLNAVRTLGRGA